MFELTDQVLTEVSTLFKCTDINWNIRKPYIHSLFTSLTKTMKFVYRDIYTEYVNQANYDALKLNLQY